MKFLLMHENVIPHDAIGNDIEKMYQILSEDNDCGVYAVNKKNKNVKYVSDKDLALYLEDKEAVIIYHVSVYWQHGYELLKRVKGKIVFRYHNITPPDFFKGYSRLHYDACIKGKRQVITLQKDFPKAYWFSASSFNARDLWKTPEDQIYVISPFNKIEEWGSTKPDEVILKKFDDDVFHLLFVGRVVPNKGHLFLIEVLRYYCYSYDGKIKLHIIGVTEDALSSYMDTIRGRIGKYNLDDKIEFVGSVNDETLTAYYKGCDAMLLCSFHEGFCVPVAEAQYFGLPIIGLRYCAVPETIGKNQLLLGPEPAEFAAAIEILRNNKDYREYLISGGKKNFDERFSFSRIKDKFLSSVKEVIDHDVNYEEIEYKSRGRIAFVSPWFGERIPGGAEAELRAIIRQLKLSGCDVEILTTRVKEFSSDWSVNYYPMCSEMIWDIPVTRFSVERRDKRAFDRVNARLMNGEHITPEEEEVFLKEMGNSPALYEYIRENYDKYDIFVFIPYMFGTTFFGIQECYDKAVLIPCFHDESYIYISKFKNVYEKIAGIIYNAYPEEELANKLFDLSEVSQEVMGLPIETDISFDPDRFKDRFDIHDPYILYAGRKDKGKGVDVLLDYFRKYKKEHKANEVKLVLIGGGEIEIPKSLKTEVYDLGFLDIQDKYDAYAAAICLCQMSKMESFSIVIMESWICGRPVLVNKECPVTTDFAERFEGGFAVGDYEDFEKYLNMYLEDPKLASKMGQNGCDEVKNRYSKEVITQKYIDFFMNVIKSRNQSEKLRYINIEHIMNDIRRNIMCNKTELEQY